MADYDPDLLQKYADRLYLQATRVLIQYAIIFAILLALVGVGLGFILSLYVTKERGSMGSLPNYPGAGSFYGGAVGLVIGVLIGNEKAFKLRLEAQRTLCLMQIEINSRARD